MRSIIQHYVQSPDNRIKEAIFDENAWKSMNETLNEVNSFTPVF